METPLLDLENLLYPFYPAPRASLPSAQTEPAKNQVPSVASASVLTTATRTTRPPRKRPSRAQSGSTPQTLSGETDQFGLQNTKTTTMVTSATKKTTTIETGQNEMISLLMETYESLIEPLIMAPGTRPVNISLIKSHLSKSIFQKHITHALHPLLNENRVLSIDILTEIFSNALVTAGIASL